MKKLILLALGCCLLFAGIEEKKVGTWNLQGASASSENKWNVSVRQLLTGENAVDVLMVQEAGSVPRTAVPTRRIIQPGGTPVQEYTWNLGTTTRPRQVYIYHSNIDVGAGRVNLAIVSTQIADEAFVIRQEVIAPNVSRPALGIRIGNYAFFSIHALANGGGDATALVSAIHHTLLDHPNVDNWLVAGDFNRNPSALQAGLGREVTDDTRIINPRVATHASASGDTRTLDYAVVGRTSRTRSIPLPAIIALLMTASVRSYLASDHFPVRFGNF